MKRIIITGATGYIGSHVTKYLLSQGFSVAIVVRAHSNLASVEGFLDRIQVITYVDIQHLIPSFKSFRPDTVLHLAACVNTHYKPEDVPSLIQSNIEFGVEILEAMKQCGCKISLIQELIGKTIRLQIMTLLPGDSPTIPCCWQLLLERRNLCMEH